MNIIYNRKKLIAACILLLLAMLLQSCSFFEDQTLKTDTTDAEINDPETETDPETLSSEAETTYFLETAPELESSETVAANTDPVTDTEKPPITDIATVPVTEPETTTVSELPEITKYVAITFDDGPTIKNMSLILDKAEEAGIGVTFFMCGYKITPKTYDVLKRALELGCELGNHSTNHANFNKCTPEQIKDEIDTTNELIEKATGVMPTLMRPPYGNMSKELGRDYDMSFVLWSVDPEDWKYRDTQTVYDNVINAVKDGDIILLHDTYTSSYEAFCLLVDELRARGYGLVTVTELLSRNGSVETGKYYYNTSVCK